ncbi:MAG: chromate transporter [Clostridiales bacterium]|nr:chromate transporter [Clostridiales bacterium]
MNLFKLFAIFAKIGATTFGGGYAMLPILQREIVDKYKLATEKELLDYYAIGQCTPGVIAVNTATFIGHKISGIKGAIVATLGVVTPSLIIIMLIAGLINQFSDYEIVQKAFVGIRICVAALIINAVINLWKNSIVDKYTLAVFGIVLLLALFTSISPVYLMIGAGVLTLIKTMKRNSN